MSAEDALLKHHKNQLPKGNRTRRGKNKKPEQETVKACMEWFDNFGFSMSVVESKAVYSATAGRYLRGQTVAGFTDSAGCTPDGIGCFVEFKAKGKLKTLREGQRQFIKDKAVLGCFTCVVDCVELLEEIYHKWYMSYKEDKESAIAYLLDQLPKQRKRPIDHLDL